jgi:hypothetical protein
LIFGLKTSVTEYYIGLIDIEYFKATNCFVIQLTSFEEMKNYIGKKPFGNLYRDEILFGK